MSGCEQSHACLLFQDVQDLENIWSTLDQLAGNRYKVPQGTGYLKRANRGLNQRVAAKSLKDGDAA